jgi:hypothetical protein
MAANKRTPKIYVFAVMLFGMKVGDLADVVAWFG